MKQTPRKFTRISDLNSIRDINDILAELAKHEQALIGTDIESLIYFSRTYGATNKVIFQAIKEGYFSQPTLMLDLQVQFARLYFETLNNYARYGLMPRQWHIAAKRSIPRFQPTILSLFLAICAHIQCDAALALKSVTTSSPRSLESDYARVNLLLLKHSTEIIKNFNPNTRFYFVHEIVKKIFVRPICFILFKLRRRAWRNFSAGTGYDGNHITKLVVATDSLHNTRIQHVYFDHDDRIEV